MAAGQPAGRTFLRGVHYPIFLNISTKQRYFTTTTGSRGFVIKSCRSTWMQYFDAGTLRFRRDDSLMERLTAKIILHVRDQVETTIAYGIKYLQGPCQRRPIRGKFPTVKVILDARCERRAGSDYYYHNLRISIADRIRIKPIGCGDYEIVAGKDLRARALFC